MASVMLVTIFFPFWHTNIPMDQVAHNYVHCMDYTIQAPAQYADIVSVCPDRSRIVSTVLVVPVNGIEIRSIILLNLRGRKCIPHLLAYNVSLHINTNTFPNLV